jgi:hypothetical protein
MLKVVKTRFTKTKQLIRGAGAVPESKYKSRGETAGDSYQKSEDQLFSEAREVERSSFDDCFRYGAKSSY